MKLNMRKIFSIVIAGISFLLIVFSFIPYIYDSSMWSKGTVGIGVLHLLILLCVIAVYLLHLFIDLKERWVAFANYGIGFVTFYHLLNFFLYIKGGTEVGFWFEFLLALGLGACSVVWYFMSEQPFASKSTPIIGYDQTTGKPIYAKIKGYDPQTGQPIYDNN